MSIIKWSNSTRIFQPTDLEIEVFLERNSSLSSQEKERIRTKHTKDLMSIFVTYQVVEDIKAHLSRDTTKETGGVLVGNVYKSPSTDSYYTEILGAIPALHTVGTISHFQFTKDCWTGILQKQNSDYSGMPILGWYHSHPGFGIFLSGTDLDTQRSYFNKPWQIAIVFDPIQKLLGFFYSSQGKKLDPIYSDNIHQNILSKETTQEISSNVTESNNDLIQLSSDQHVQVHTLSPIKYGNRIISIVIRFLTRSK
jgi:proteasome lid subunit RPN8/RPN11